MSNKTKVGVIVGRFQVHKLHEGHQYLYDVALEECDRVIAVLGCTGGQPTDVDPFPYGLRRKMLEGAFVDHQERFSVVRLPDTGENQAWSRALDRVIRANTEVDEDVLLYGSRDSFANSYYGAYLYKEIDAITVMSGTAVRESYSWDEVQDLESAMVGAALAAQEKYPIAYQTVDVAVLSKDRKQVLIGRKPDRDKWCFIGGFVDPGETLEMAALRETAEETDGSIVLSGDDPFYIGSLAVDDHRYRRSRDGITTTFFGVEYSSGTARAGDDLEEVMWCDVEDLGEYLGKNHLPLADLLYKKLGLAQAVVA